MDLAAAPDSENETAGAVDKHREDMVRMQERERDDRRKGELLLEDRHLHRLTDSRLREAAPRHWRGHQGNIDPAKRKSNCTMDW